MRKIYFCRPIWGQWRGFVLVLFSLSALVACFDQGQDDGEKAGLDSQPNTQADLVVKAGKNSEVQLNASEPNGEQSEGFEYTWQMISMPEHSQAVLSDVASSSPIFTADVTGIYVTRLITMNDGNVISSDDITVKALPMIAYAGLDQAVKTGAIVTLNKQPVLLPNGDFLPGFEPGFIPNDGDFPAVLEPGFIPYEGNVPPGIELAFTSYNFDAPSGVEPAFISYDGGVPPDMEPRLPKNGQTPLGVTSFPGFIIDDPFLPDGLTVTWSFVSLPEGSSASLSDVNAMSPSFVADVVGEYVINMEVDDGIQKTSDTVTISAYDLKAMAGYDSAVMVESEVQLDGSGSWNVDGDLSYQWSYVSVPLGSAAMLSDGTVVNPTFIPDVDGTYVIALEVSDGSVTDKDTVAIIAFIDYNVGIGMRAYAGPDQDVKTEATVTLSGDGSGTPGAFGDPDNLPPGIELAIAVIDNSGLSYEWSFVSVPDNSTAAFSDASLVSPSFVADVIGEYVVKLEVSDDSQVSSDIVVITAHDLKAMAGDDIFSMMGHAVQLDGSASWNVISDLSYQWSLVAVPEGSQTSLSDVSVVNPTLTPDQEGTYELSLTVNDGTNSDTDTLSIHVMRDFGLAAQAYAGHDQAVKIGDSVQLNSEGVIEPIFMGGGIQSELKYIWSLVSVPPGSAAQISEPNAIALTFVADKEGDYIVALEVHDAQQASRDEVVISAFSLKAMAGHDQYVPIGMSVPLDGSGSWSLAGAFTYQWKLISTPVGSKVILENDTSDKPTVMPDVDGRYIVELTMSDDAREDKDTLVIFTAFSDDNGRDPVSVTATAIH